MGVIPIHEAIVKGANKSSLVNLPDDADTPKPGQSASPPTRAITNLLTPASGRSRHSERQTFSAHLMQSSRNSVSEIGCSTTTLQSSTILNTTTKTTLPNTAFTTRMLSKSMIRRNCAYATVSKSFPYYIPVPSTAKLNAKPKKYQSFLQTAAEQEQDVLSPSGSEGSSRDSGFNSDSSSPVPPIGSSDIEQLLDEIASLDDIN